MIQLKHILVESKYDTLSKKISSIIIGYIKESLEDYDIEFPSVYDDKIKYNEYTLPLEITIDRSQIKELEKKGYYITGGVVPPLKPKKIAMSVYLNRKLESKLYSRIYSELVEVLRHEIQHLTQGGKYQKPNRPELKKSLEKSTNKNSKGNTTRYEYSIKPEELDALSYGFFSQAKQERVPVTDIIKRNLYTWIKGKEINKEEYKELYKRFVEYIKKNISSAKF